MISAIASEAGRSASRRYTPRRDAEVTQRRWENVGRIGETEPGVGMEIGAKSLIGNGAAGVN